MTATTISVYTKSLKSYSNIPWENQAQAHNVNVDISTILEGVLYLHCLLHHNENQAKLI